MSKRQIQRALKVKGLECSILEYTHQTTPGEVVGGWDVELSPKTEELVATADPSFDDWEPDCFNTTEVLEWIDTLPDVRSQ